MALLRYLKPINGLPNPKSPLSSEIPSSVIAEANREVQEATKNKKRGPYKTYMYSPSVRFEIGSYAYQHGVHVASGKHGIHEHRDFSCTPPCVLFVTAL